MRQILITNDDGIRSDGLLRLARAATVFGQVWVVAPERQRSAASQSITLHKPIDLYPVPYPVEGVRAFAISGTPADCIRLGILNVLHAKPDLVLSGINYGYNAATDMQYSATVGAALEARFQGCQAIALSEDATPHHPVTGKWLEPVLVQLLDRPLGPRQIWNVNFPGCPLEQCQGVLEGCTVSSETFFLDRYQVQEELENGVLRLMVDGRPNPALGEPGSDFRALKDGYVSVGVVTNLG